MVSRLFLVGWAWVAVSVGLSADSWPTDLSCSGGGLFAARRAVVIHNTSEQAVEGFPVALSCDAAGGGLGLVGSCRVEELRVCDEAGRELLFAVRDEAGQIVEIGVIPPGAELVVPAVCSAKSSTTIFIYFDNPQAWRVPEFFEAYPGIVNGDLELGEGVTPFGWRHDQPTAQHRTFWTDEVAFSGRKCLKTVVAPGAEPSWIATRQHGIAIRGGARYRLQGWVKAESVEGYAGWYIHLGNRTNPMLQAPMLSGGGGTYDWKKVELEFVAPAEATQASVGTVLWGTGTAWFDAVKLECLDPAGLSAELGPIERLRLRQVGSLTQPWTNATELLRRQPGSQPAGTFLGRARICVVNTREIDIPHALVAVPSERLRAELAPRYSARRLLFSIVGKPAPFYDGETLLFEAALPARSVTNAFVYLAADDVGDAPLGNWSHLVAGPRNLVENPSFEADGQSPVGWWIPPAGKEGPVVEIVHTQNAPSGLGPRVARLTVSKELAPQWPGLRQRVKITGGESYLVGGFLRTQEVAGDVRMHVHFRKADGSLAGAGAMTSVGPSLSGSKDWTLLSGIVNAPAEATFLEIHLTANCPGMIEYDGIFVGQVIRGTLGELEAVPSDRPASVTLWQVPAVVKVFPDSLPPAAEDQAPWEIAAACNEWEVLQIAVRSHQAVGEVEIRVDSPVNESGDKLSDWEIFRCGYVPVDYPTNYYQSVEPAWYRRLPRGSPGCDGWVGWWPDPLLPCSSLVLDAQKTHAVWIIFRIDGSTRPGLYRGRIRLVKPGEEKTLAEREFFVRIWDFALPKQTDFIAVYDVRYGPGGRWWGRSLDEMYPKIVEFLAARRLCPDVIRPAPRLRWTGEGVDADFSEFDRAAEWYFDKLGLPVAYMPWDFYVFGWGLPPKTIAGVKPYPGEPPYENVDRSKLSPEYKRVYQSLLRTFWDHVRARGWHRKFVLYVSDEPFAHREAIRKQFAAICQMIHEVDPEIPIYSSTWYVVDEWIPHLDVWGIGHYGIVLPEKMAQLRQAGRRIWFTTDGQMCVDTPFCAVERLLPYYCFRYGAEGYEFWGVSWYTYDPHRFGWHAFIPQTDEPGHSYYIRYPNGDGYLVYPGLPESGVDIISSIRLEQAREGVEDYCYLRLAKETVDQADRLGKKGPSVAKLQTVLGKLMDLISVPNAGGRYSTKILPDPWQFERWRVELGAALEEARKEVVQQFPAN